MKKQEAMIYYRYFCRKESVFWAVVRWFSLQTKKRAGKKWAKEHKEWSKKINKSISWLPENELDKNIKYYFTEKGMERYEKTLLKVHEDILKGKKISKKKFEFFTKRFGDKIMYNKKDRRKIGKMIYRDKYQVGIKLK